MTNGEIVYAEDLNYWKTGQSSPDTWIDHARKEIELAGGTVDNEAFGRDSYGRAAYMLAFSFGEDHCCHRLYGWYAIQRSVLGL